MNLILLGDSYTFGQGCSDPSKTSWAGLLQSDHPNVQVKNLSLCGSDNLTIAQQLWINHSHHVDVIVFCASFEHRIQVLNPLFGPDMIEGEQPETKTLMANYDYPWSINDPRQRNFKKSKDLFYRYLYDKNVGRNYTTSAILSTYACAKISKSDFYWSVPLINSPTQLDVILAHEIHHKFLACCDINYDSSEKAPCGHPNDRGHKRYYDEIIGPLLAPYF